MSLFVKERVETGRIYFMNIDHCNQKSAWDDDIKMTNLCVEVLHPTKPLQHIDDKDAEIGICILSAINVLEIKPWLRFLFVLLITFLILVLIARRRSRR